MWTYTDENGVKCEEHFTAEQLMIDRQVLGEFGTMEREVAEGEPAPRVASDAPICKKIAQLPEKRASHWHAELARIGVKIQASKPAIKEQAAQATAKVEAPKTVTKVGGLK